MTQLLPRQSVSIQDNTAVAGSTLCVSCGLCCSGGIFDHGSLTDGEARLMAAKGNTVFTKDGSEGEAIRFPCNCLVNNTCTIYRERPQVCRDFRCSLLKRTTNGSIAFDKALEIVERAGALRDWLTAAGRDLGYAAADEGNLRNALYAALRVLRRKQEDGFLDAQDEDYALHALEYLKIVDRELRPIRLLKGYADFVQSVAWTQKNAGTEKHDDVTTYQFGGTDGPIVFRNCKEAAEATKAILRGWPVETARSAGDHSMLVSRTGDIYKWEKPATGEHSSSRTPLRTLEDIVADVHYELIDWYLADHPDQLCLHAAAVEIGGGLVVMPSTHRSGKSSLCVALSMLGCRVFGDDRLAIEQDARRGHSVGMLPRLRRPIPGVTSHASLKDYVERHKGLAGENHIYVDLPEERFAPRGMSAPIRAVVLLDRNNTGKPASLVRENRAEGLKALIAQNFNRRFSASRILGTLESLVNDSEVLALRYTRLDDAAAALSQYFSSTRRLEIAV